MKIIKLPHRVCDYTCMINGLEDQYEHKTGIRPPEYLFFFLSGMCGFAYISQKNASTPKMVFWGSNPKGQYERMSKLLNLEWNYSEGNSFNYVMNAAKSKINDGLPVILGALDMYHLPYYTKFYHKMHIPIHYVNMVGYDDEKECAYILDCGLTDLQTVPYYDLMKALDVNLPGLSKKNTFHWFIFNNTPSLKDIIFNGLKLKSDFMLNPPVKFLGVHGIKKLSEEIGEWEGQLYKREFKKCLMHFVEYSGSVVPMLPSKLLHFPMESHFDVHQGQRDRFSRLLKELSTQYHSKEMEMAAELLKESGKLIQIVNDEMVTNILNKKSDFKLIKNSLEKIAELERKAYIELSVV